MAKGISFPGASSALPSHQIAGRDGRGNDDGFGKPKILEIFADRGKRKAVLDEGGTIIR